MSAISFCCTLLEIFILVRYVFCYLAWFWDDISSRNICFSWHLFFCITRCLRVFLCKDTKRLFFFIVVVFLCVKLFYSELDTENNFKKSMCAYSLFSPWEIWCCHHTMAFAFSHFHSIETVWCHGNSRRRRCFIWHSSRWPTLHAVSLLYLYHLG